MNSYDVYTSRMSIRQLFIPINDNEELKISDSKNRKLSKYMSEFTRPPINQVYGDYDVKIQNIDQLIDMFKSPDQQRALENLRKLARSLKMDLQEIPNFLEDYGDIFLSLAYFKECVDRIVSNVEVFLTYINSFKYNFQLKPYKNLLKHVNTWKVL